MQPTEENLQSRNLRTMREDIRGENVGMTKKAFLKMIREIAGTLTQYQLRGEKKLKREQLTRQPPLLPSKPASQKGRERQGSDCSKGKNSNRFTVYLHNNATTNLTLEKRGSRGPRVNHRNTLRGISVTGYNLTSGESKCKRHWESVFTHSGTQREEVLHSNEIRGRFRKRE